MAQNENGIETTNRILAVSRELFYEEGYNATTFADIAAKARVNKSAIHYHFKSKENLLKSIYSGSIQKNNLTAERYFTKNTIPLAKYLFSGIIYNYKVFTDEKYRRFIIDSQVLFRGENLNETVLGMARILFRNDSDFLILTDAKFHDLLAIMGYTNSLASYIDANMSSCSLTSINHYVEEEHRKILQIGESEYKLAREQLAELELRCEWSKLDTTLRPDILLQL